MVHVTFPENWQKILGQFLGQFLGEDTKKRMHDDANKRIYDHSYHFIYPPYLPTLNHPHLLRTQFLFSSNHSQPKGETCSLLGQKVQIKAKQGSKCVNYFWSIVQLKPADNLDYISLQILEAKTFRYRNSVLLLHVNQRKQ